MRKSAIKWAAVAMAGVLVAGCLSGTGIAEAKKNPKKAKAEKAKKVDLDGTYHAALGISTSTNLWINRNAYFAKKANSYYGTKRWDKLMSEDSRTGEKIEHAGSFTDVEIAGNGTYTVSLEGADFAGETAICMLHVATDIPLNHKITFSNVSAEINGRTVVSFEEAYMEDEKKPLAGGMDILLLNHWREELVSQLSSRGLKESSANGYELLNGTGDDVVKVSFTVNGFHYNKGQEMEIEETPAPTPVATPEPEQTAVSEEGTEEEINTGGTGAWIALVIAAGIALCGVVIVVVNSRSRRK